MHFISKTIVSSLFLFLSFLSFAQPEKLTLTNNRFRAIINRDSIQLDAVLADDVIIIHSNGLVETKKEHIHNIISGKIIYSKMDLKEMVSKKYWKTQINNGVVNVKGKYDGKDFEILLRFTEVYGRRNGKWLLTNWQSTKVT